MRARRSLARAQARSPVRAGKEMASRLKSAARRGKWRRLRLRRGCVVDGSASCVVLELGVAVRRRRRAEPSHQSSVRRARQESARVGRKAEAISTSSVGSFEPRSKMKCPARSLGESKTERKLATSFASSCSLATHEQDTLVRRAKHIQMLSTASPTALARSLLRHSARQPATARRSFSDCDQQSETAGAIALRSRAHSSIFRLIKREPGEGARELQYSGDYIASATELGAGSLKNADSAMHVDTAEGKSLTSTSHTMYTHWVHGVSG